MCKQGDIGYMGPVVPSSDIGRRACLDVVAGPCQEASELCACGEFVRPPRSRSESLWEPSLVPGGWVVTGSAYPLAQRSE